MSITPARCVRIITLQKIHVILRFTPLFFTADTSWVNRIISLVVDDSRAESNRQEVGIG